MTVKRFSRREFSASLASAMALGPVAAMAAERTRKIDPKDVRTVEFFDAKNKGDINVKFIPKDATVATLIIENKTDKPLSIELPKAFAGVPVLAQFGGGGGGFGGGGGGLGGGGGGGGGQGLGGGGGGFGGGGGGGFGGGGGGFGGGGGGGFFNVAPEKVGKVKLPCVCLEHGKPDPTPRMKYDIVPLETLTKDPKVAELCKMLGNREVPQNSAQAAAWHLANGMSWNELAKKNRVESKYTGNVRFFNRRELALAVRIVGAAIQRAKVAEPTEKSPGEKPYRTGQNQTGG